MIITLKAIAIIRSELGYIRDAVSVCQKQWDLGHGPKRKVGTLHRGQNSK